MNMNVSIGRLTFVFMGLFLLVSLVMVNIQVFPYEQLQKAIAGSYNPRHCLPDEQPLRGTIYDREGVWLVKSVADSTALCGYRRVWNPAAVNAGLAPLIGYFSYKYGATGVEAQYNDVLSGAVGTTLQCNVLDPNCLIAQGQATYNQLLHQQAKGSDIYMTIDLKLQQQVNALYNQDVITGGACQAPGSNPPGSILVEDPATGEMLAMLSRPYYDPNRIDDAAYWKQVTTDPSSPLLDRATQSRYPPGSDFKTITLAAGLDSGQYQLTTPFTLDDDTSQDKDLGNGGDQDHDQDQDQALYFTVPSGETIAWDDYFPRPGSNGWVGIPSPVTLQDGYSYSDNVIYARVAVQLGKDGWLNYVRRFGIATPGTPVSPVPFDSAYVQSRAYNPASSSNPAANFNNDLLAESGFGQGQLFITPLTMAEVTSTMAADGQLFVPHVLFATAAPGQKLSDAVAQSPQLYTGQPVIRPETAAAVRQAMRAVVEYGTVYHTSTALVSSPAQEGGKTGTAQVPESSLGPHAWWISMAPATSSSPGKLAIVVMKEHSGEGACQIFVGDDIYRCASADGLVQLGDLGPCPARP
jgi:cell division protein FtsI/penicillin-binding protein 2